MSFLDRLKRRTVVDEMQSEGLSAAIEAVKQFDQRTFCVTGQGLRASHVPSEEVSRFLEEEFPDYYSYTTKVQTYTKPQDVLHARIEIKGWSGLSQQMNRYNPFDMTCTIRTEPPASN